MRGKTKSEVIPKIFNKYNGLCRSGEKVKMNSFFYY